MHKSTLKIILLSLNACLGSFYFGYQVGVLNLGDKTINVVFNIKDDGTESALLQTQIPIGALVGVLMSGYLIQTLSRRNMMAWTDLIGIVGSLLSMVKNIYTFFLARFVSGLYRLASQLCRFAALRSAAPLFCHR